MKSPVNNIAKVGGHFAFQNTPFGRDIHVGDHYWDKREGRILKAPASLDHIKAPSNLLEKHTLNQMATVPRRMQQGISMAMLLPKEIIWMG